MSLSHTFGFRTLATHTTEKRPMIENLTNNDVKNLDDTALAVEFSVSN